MFSRVLVVDNHDELRRLFMVWLEGEEGSEVTGGARTAAEAVKLLKNQPADVVLLDLDVEDEDATSAIRTVKEAFPDIHVVGMTWDNASDRVAKMIDAGAGCVFDKAEKLTGLLRAIGKCFE